MDREFLHISKAGSIECNKLILIAFVFSIFLFPPLTLSQTNPHLFTTGSILELDRCASAWLIKRYVDPAAVFKFFPDGELIPEGTAFDTPDAKLTRTHNRSTFEVILQHYNIEQDQLGILAGYIREVEMNFWSGQKSEEAAQVEREVIKIIQSTPDPQECLGKCFTYFDTLIQRLGE